MEVIFYLKEFGSVTILDWSTSEEFYKEQISKDSIERIYIDSNLVFSRGEFDEFLKHSPFLKDSTKKGVKHNSKKPKMSLLFKQFPKALEAIVKCSEYGNEKYKETDHDFMNFKRVEGGSQTYADASLRHRLIKGNDEESGLPHAYHIAWNALAELELYIEENSR